MEDEEYDDNCERRPTIGCDPRASFTGDYASPRISSEFMDCSTPFSLDLFNRCSFQCRYCFAFFSKQNNPSYKEKETIDLKAVDVKYLQEVFEGKHPENPYWKHFVSKRKVLHIGGLADNFCYIERHHKHGVAFIEYLPKTGYPTIISTKGIFMDIPEYRAMFEKYKDVAQMAIQASIITHKEEVARRVEVGVSPPKARFEQLRWLSDLGYWTILRLRPFIVGISSAGLGEFLEMMKEYRVRGLSTEFYCLDMRANEEDKKLYDEMSALAGFDLVAYYKKLSPSSRGSYRRLNRDVKEPYVKQMYKFCKENGMLFACSDPDYKELNTTGSCCGLPDDWNFCRNQLTRLIRDVRERIAKGGPPLVYYRELVQDVEEEKWKSENQFANCDPSTISVSTSERIYHTHSYMFLERWNNPEKMNSPFRYFDGKLVPHGIDEDGNLIYRYVEHAYERAWKKEGLL